MSSYAIFNYQFDKIMRRAEEGSLFPTNGEEMDADEAFPLRQEILDDIINQDFHRKRVIVFSSKRSRDKEFIHRYVTKPADHITLMRIANRRTTTIVTEELKEKTEPDYQNCMVIIDNRPGIQRILIEIKKVANMNGALPLAEQELYYGNRIINVNIYNHFDGTINTINFSNV